MLRRNPLRRGDKPLQASTPLRRHTGLSQVGRRRSGETAGAGRPVRSTLTSRPRPAVPELRAALLTRSLGRCEIDLPGCTEVGTDVAHRISVKAGGRHGAATERHHRPSNTMLSCRACHQWIHARPAEAYELGLMLREHHNPAAEPVLYRGRLSYLTDDGQVIPFETAHTRGAQP